MDKFENNKNLIFEVLDDKLFTEIDKRIKDTFSIKNNNEIIINGKIVKIEYQHWFSSKKSRRSRQLNIKIKYNNDLDDLHIVKFLEKIKKYILDKERKFVLLIDEASEYYRNISYNKLQKIEVYLRSLIYKVLIKHKGDLWDKFIIPIIQNLNIRNIDQIKNNPDFMLQELDFGTLINLFFDDLITFDYSSLPKDEELKTKTIEELIQIINSTKPISINKLYFGKYSLSLDDFKQIQKYRNNVMHFKEIKYNNYSQFSSAANRQLKILETIIKDLEGNSLEDAVNIISKIDFSGIIESMRNVATKFLDIAGKYIKNIDE